MASLLKILRLSTFKGQILPIFRNLTTQPNIHIKTPPLTLTSLINPWIIQKEEKIRLPVLNNNQINLPSGMFYIPKIDKNVQDEIDEPSKNFNDEIQAARLIIIRRKKMRKHKLQKLRKKMRFEWAKVRQKRELKKEKEFQAVLIQKCKEADAFSAESYVQSRIDKLNELIAFDAKKMLSNRDRK
ncbi:uncharacterized protein [Onthophagus taurus]|uniref:uncharacterized protein n=1 Tax=Onthophagus taurus TaxID=166361 RepID=UPI0039BDF5EB